MHYYIAILLPLAVSKFIVGFNINNFYILPTPCICVCFLYGSQNKQQLFTYTALTDWFL